MFWLLAWLFWLVVRVFLGFLNDVRVFWLVVRVLLGVFACLLECSGWLLGCCMCVLEGC